MKIYLKLDKTPKTIKELLLALFSFGANTRRTNVITYSDKDCTVVQCKEGKYRSFDEVYDIIDTYFPNTSLKQAIHELITLDFGLSEPLYIKMTNCSTINRIVFYYTNEYFSTSIFNISKYNSNYSWDELLKLINVKSIEELKNYVKKYIKIKKDISDKVYNISTLSKYSRDFKLPYSIKTEDRLEKYINASYILAKVAEVYNEGTVLDWTNLNQTKYLPYKYFSLGGGSEVGCSGGWIHGLGTSGCLYYKSAKLSKASYDNFKQYWEDFWIN